MVVMNYGLHPRYGYEVAHIYNTTIQVYIGEFVCTMAYVNI